MNDVRTRPQTDRVAALLGASLAVWGAACGGGGGAGPGGGSGGASDNEWENCTWNGTTSTRTPGAVMLTGNNSADLTGAPLGSATPDLASQRKKITVRVDSPAPEVSVGDAYLWRNTPATESAYLVVAVTNVSDHLICSVIGSAYAWLDGSGATVMMGDQIFVDGSVAVRQSGDFSDSCLGAGEKGYFTDVQVPNGSMALYSMTETVTFTLSGPFSSGTAPAGNLVPQAYDIGTCPDKAAVKVSVTNTGAGQVALEKFSLSPAVLLDDAGLPAGWLYLQADKVTVAAGASATVYSSLFMEPNVRRLQVYVDFTEP